VEARLPQDGVAEQTFDEDYLRILLDLLPRVQATLSAPGKKR
jgi:hypothetical protein